MSRRDEPVSPVVPFPAHHDRAPAVPAAEQIETRPRHARPGALHQHLGGRPGGLRGPIERPGLRGREQRPHPSVTATANATALVFSWVKVISTRLTPSASARSLALPASAMIGAPLGCLVTLMSCQSLPR